MVSATQTSPTTDRSLFVDSIPSLAVYLHIVTLIKRSTGEEACLHIETTSGDFLPVHREIAHQKAIRKLFGYEIFEVLDCNAPF